MADTTWLTTFPEMERTALVALRKTLDGAYLEFSRAYGDAIESFFDPLLYFLVWFEKLLVGAPWWLVLAALAALAHAAGRSMRLTLGVAAALLVIGYFGMWDDTMKTLSVIAVATLIAVALGIPVGILMARSDRVQAAITLVLDVMQTMPAFVYLIPVVMLLGIGKVPGIIAVVVYAIPPVIRLTNLGIRLVDREVLEAATAFGASRRQRLLRVQLPLAMVVIASMIGVQGLGQPVLKAITNQYFTLGLLNGLAIAAVAIVIDRVSQAYARRSHRHLGGLGGG